MRSSLFRFQEIVFAYETDFKLRNLTQEHRK